jgi:hypothetical protein
MLQRISIMLGLVILLAVAARADKVTSDFDHNVNFSKYKTFMWVQPPDTPDPFMQDRIMNSVNSQLNIRGLREVNEGADLAVGANMATEEKQAWETYYNGADWGWGTGWSETTEQTYLVGTLTVNLFDADSHKIIWQGVGVDTVSRKPEKRTKDNNKQIEKMFRYFPYGKEK